MRSDCSSYHTGLPNGCNQAFVRKTGGEQSLRGQVGSCAGYRQTRALHGQLQQRERGGVRNTSGEWRSSPALRRPISLARAGLGERVTVSSRSDSNTIRLPGIDLLLDEFRKTLD